MKPLIRRGLALTAATAFVLGLAGCGGSDGPAGDASSVADPVATVELRLYWWGGDARHERTQQAIDAFMAKYPNIKVTGEFSDWSGYWDKLATSTAGGNSPDVVQMDQLYLASYAARDTLTDLGAVSTLDTSQLEPAVLGMGQWGGRQYAMPVSTAAFGLLVNLDVLDQYGVTLPDTEKWNWDDLKAFGLEIAEKSGGAVAGVAPMGNEYSLQLFARQKGDNLFEDDQIAIRPETLAAYFQHALDLAQSGAGPSASRLSETAGLAIDQSDFATGKVAAIFSQVSQVSAYTAGSGANVQIVKTPSFDANQTKYEYFKPGMYWAMSAQTDHPEEAGRLIDFLINDPEAAAILGTERGLPANPAMLDSLTATLTENEAKAVAYSQSLEGLLGDAPAIVPNGASELDKIIARYQQEVLFEQRTALDAANAMIKEVKDSINSAA
ncbi:MAG: extracellular solute-binding protein [Propionibacteriaceae bacterium]|jgi:multiple sugar transport system substrate-binding protein|nr:extracellular solute-binding protein [Propionibacteriaceae bacterium]